MRGIPLTALDVGRAAVQAWAKAASLAALLAAMVDCRLASAAIRPRALLATEFAPLNHMLMNGFFLSQGLDIDFLRDTVPR